MGLKFDLRIKGHTFNKFFNKDGNSEAPRQCFNCGDTGHTSRMCPQNQNRFNSRGGGGGRGGFNSRGRGGGRGGFNSSRSDGGRGGGRGRGSLGGARGRG